MIGWDRPITDPLAALPDSARADVAGRAGDASLLCGPDAVLYLAWTMSTLDSTDLWLSRSADLGDHLTEATRVNDAPGKVVVGDGGQIRPEVAFGSSGEIFALWTDSRSGVPMDSDVYCARSVDGGATFAEGVLVDAGPDSTAQTLASLHVDADGRPWAVWLDSRGSTPETPYLMRVFVARSPDGGRSFLPSVDATASQAHGVCPCCRPAVAASGAEVLVVFRNEVDDVRDIALARSRDGGATFEPPRAVADEGWRLGTCPADGPAVAILPNGRFCAAWSSGAGGARTVRFVSASLGDTAFAAPSTFGPLAAAAEQEYPAIYTRGEFIALSWEERSGGTNGPVFSLSRDGGRTFSPAAAIAPPGSAGGIAPRAALAGTRHLLFSWSMADGGLRFARALLREEV